MHLEKLSPQTPEAQCVVSCGWRQSGFAAQAALQDLPASACQMLRYVLHACLKILGFKTTFISLCL